MTRFSLAADLIARMPAGGFLRHAVAISSGVALAQGITLVSSPIITRLYPPSVYGTVATLASVSAVCLVAASLRYEVAIPIAVNDEEAISLTALSFVCGVLFTVILGTLLVVTPSDVLANVGLGGAVSGYRWLIPVLVVAASFQTVISQFGTFRRSYRALATAQTLQASASSGIKVAAGFLIPDVAGLVVGELARRCLGFGIIVRQAGLQLRELLEHCHPARLKATAAAYRRYPAFVLPSSILNTLSLQAPVMVLAAHFSTVESGLYAIGLAAVQVPLTLIEAGVSNAFISRIRDYERSGRLADVMTRMIQVLAIVSAPWFAVAAAWGPELMAFAFGARWRDGGTYLSLLSPWLFVGFVFSACGMVLWARNRQGADFGWQVLFVTLRLSALELGSRSGSASVAVGAFGAVSFVVLASYNWWLLRLAGVALSRSLAYAIRELGGYCIVAFGARYLLSQFGNGNELLGLLATGGVVGALGLWRVRGNDAVKSMWGA